VGTGSGNWNVTVGNDNNPDAFNFADQTGVNTASQISSDILQVTGINVATNVSISGNGTPQFRICSDNTCGTEIITWGNTAQTINNNQYLQLRLTSSGAQTTTSTASVVVGTGSDSWSVTTGDNAPATFSFTNQAMFRHHSDCRHHCSCCRDHYWGWWATV
jgi:hypothetical protein